MYLLLLVFVFLGCGNDDYQMSEESFSVNDSNMVFKPKLERISIDLNAELHRGKKWSRKNNVEPCTTSFGLCNVRVGIGASVGFKKIRIHILELEGNFARISFLEDVGVNEEDIFYSIDDDYFSLPQEFSREL